MNIQSISILSTLRAPKVHFEGCDKSSCDQNQVCLLFKESERIIDDVIVKLGNEFEIFVGTFWKFIGSIRENTRVGQSDEIDTLIQLRSDLATNFTFNARTQNLMVNFKNSMANVLAPYTLSDNVFDGKKFFEDFTNSVFKILKH